VLNLRRIAESLAVTVSTPILSGLVFMQGEVNNSVPHNVVLDSAPRKIERFHNLGARWSSADGAFFLRKAPVRFRRTTIVEPLLEWNSQNCFIALRT
jgi:hypothetical protein